MHPNDRSRLRFMIRYAARHPGRIVPHGRRLARDAMLRLKNRDHVGYYRAVMKADAARSDEGAVGSHTHESWLKIGQMQFDYLVSHGLKPGMRMLEIGCGNLRAGRLFIDHLDAGDYYGIDISPDILLAAQRTLAEAGLQDKLPHLTLVQDLKLAVPAGQALRRGARAQRVLALPGRGHRGVPGARRADHEAGRLLRLHLRPDRGRRAPGAARGLLLPDRDPGGAGRPVRPNRTIHDRLGRTSA